MTPDARWTALYRPMPEPVQRARDIVSKKQKQIARDVLETMRFERSDPFPPKMMRLVGTLNGPHEQTIAQTSRGARATGDRVAVGPSWEGR
jgi:hypothetical protein